jgi:hypothetical protein
MSSEIQKLSEELNRVSLSLSDIRHKVNDPSNMYLSIASVSSVSADRTICNLLILDKNIQLPNVESRILCTQLNTVGHLKSEDIVLVMYNYPSLENASIIAKLNQIGKKYATDEAFKVTNRLDISKYAF